MGKLGKVTEDLAAAALSGKWGRELVRSELVLSAEEDAQPDPYLRYAYAVRHIACEAPIRILPDELVVGAATLRESAFHSVPVYKRDGELLSSSISHVTLGFSKILETGYEGLRERIAVSRANKELSESQRNFLDACDLTLDAMQIWHGRYIKQLEALASGSSGERRAHYLQIIDNLKDVPLKRPENFKQAVQSLCFMFVFQRQCGNWPGIGRIDLMLGRYLEADLARGAITLDEAREYLAHFWIKGCEWAGCSDVFCGSGDGQHYQNIILSGVDETGRVVVNDVTYLVLDVVEQLRISDFPIAVRISRRTPEKLLRRIAEVQRLGGGIVAVYNEEFIIRQLTDFGYPLEEARNFANDGCWEIQIPGKTCFAYSPVDTLDALQRALGLGGAHESFASFEELYEAYMRQIRHDVDILLLNGDGWGKNGSANTLVSMFTDSCIENAKGYYDRGADYYVFSIHARGLPDVINSLFAIKKAVYEDKRLTLEQLLTYMENDWNGAETVRLAIRNGYVWYGNSNEEVDSFGKKVLHDFAEAANSKERKGVKRPVGASTFGSEVQASHERFATADGHKKGEYLSSNLSASPGTDINGPTAVMLSHCSLGLSCLVNGTALDLKLSPESVRGSEGIDAIVALYRTFIDNGGIFLHVNVVDNDTLLDAMSHPDRYPTLSVRVSGWSARFASLNREYQQMIINRTVQSASGQ